MGPGEGWVTLVLHVSFYVRNNQKTLLFGLYIKTEIFRRQSPISMVVTVTGGEGGQGNLLGV